MTEKMILRTALIRNVRAGDRVTIETRHGQHRTGRAVMIGPAGWALNMGGPHGTPAIADAFNIVRVTRKRKLPVCWKCGRAIRDAEYTQEQDGTTRHLNACPAR